MKQICKTFKDWQSKQNNLEDWRADEDCASFFEYVPDPSIVKAEFVFKNCDHRRLFKLLSDITSVTRFRWDRGVQFGLGALLNIRILQEVETKKNERYWVIDFLIAPCLANYENRYFQGLFWVRKDSMVIFVSHMWDPTKQPKKSVLGTLEYGCLIRESGYLSMTILKLDFGGYMPRRLFDIESFVTHFLYLESLAKNSELYLKIYSPFKCAGCRTVCLPESLECTICHQERFGRCSDKGCGIPVEEGVEKCPKCQSKINKVHHL